MNSRTPSIKRHKESLQELEKHVAGHFGHRFSLTATASKDRPMSWQDSSASRTKGVESDLIVIFEDSSKPVSYIKTSRFRFDDKPVYDSFAFSFNRISADSDEMSVNYSTKINGTIESSTPFSQDLFRDLLRKINRQFREEGAPKDRQTLLWRLSAVFLNNPQCDIHPYDESDSLNKVLGKDRERILELKDKRESAQNLYMETTSEISSLESLIDQESKTSPEAMAIKRLQDEIKTLKATMSKKKKAAFKKRGGQDLVKEQKRLESERDSASKKLISTIESINKRIPSDPATSSGVRHWLEENS